MYESGVKTLSPTHHPVRRAEAPLLRSSAARDHLLYEFEGAGPTPEQMAHLIAGLKTHFGEIRITVETAGQVRVIARESNPRLVERMKSFCAGFALLL